MHLVTKRKKFFELGFRLSPCGADKCLKDLLDEGETPAGTHTRRTFTGEEIVELKIIHTDQSVDFRKRLALTLHGQS